MSGVTVLYDGRCGFCRATVRVLARWPRASPLAFVAQESAAARAAFPALVTDGAPESLVAVDASGGVHRAERAWAVLLGALRGCRWAGRVLGWPVVRPAAGVCVRWVARNRFRLSRLVPGGGGVACGCGGATGCGAERTGV